MRQALSKDLIKKILQRPINWSPMTLAELDSKYPLRDLPDGAMVTRFAPSPTGFMHLGGLYQMLINYKLVKQSNGIFMLRVEDTDTKREVSGAVELILDTANKFDLMPDEKPVFDSVQNMQLVDSPDSKYGPYLQSCRKDIYHSIALELLATGRAYPCFLNTTDMAEIRAKQTSDGLPTGIYGEFARDRDLTESEITARLDAGEIPSIRLYSMGDPARKIYCKDGARGSIAFPENNEDIVLIKSGDGLPTYHFAHLCDDHFMRTTNVIRGEEWLPSLPLHIGLFNIMGWTPPVYVHTSTLDKIDLETGKQRKLSKRSDPEASVAKFLEDGWPTEAVLEYLLNIASSGFEEEKSKNPNTNLWNYPIKIKKIPMSGALFDMKKLEWFAREYIGTLSGKEIYERIKKWITEGEDLSDKADQEKLSFQKSSDGIFGKCKVITNEWSNYINSSNEEYLINILSIERGDPKRVRKDFVTWKQTLQEISYFFDELFVPNTEFEFNKNVLDSFCAGFDINDDKDTWWKKIVQIANDYGLKNGDVAMNLRVAITGRTNTPDLYSLIQVMGNDRFVARLEKQKGIL